MIDRVLILIVLPFWLVIWMVESAVFGARRGAAIAWKEWQQVWNEKRPTQDTPAPSSNGSKVRYIVVAQGPRRVQ